MKHYDMSEEDTTLTMSKIIAVKLPYATTLISCHCHSVQLALSDYIKKRKLVSKLSAIKTKYKKIKIKTYTPTRWSSIQGTLESLPDVIRATF